MYQRSLLPLLSTTVEPVLEYPPDIWSKDSLLESHILNAPSQTSSIIPQTFLSSSDDVIKEYTTRPSSIGQRRPCNHSLSIWLVQRRSINLLHKNARIKDQYLGKLCSICRYYEGCLWIRLDKTQFCRFSAMNTERKRVRKLRGKLFRKLLLRESVCMFSVCLLN